MIRQRLSYKFIFLILALSISSCGPGELFGPTITPSPTLTFTPTLTPTPTSTLTPTPKPTFTPSRTPIPGIGSPIIIDDASIQIKSATLGIEPPTGYYLRSSSHVLLSVDFSISGDIAYKDLVIIDENGYESSLEILTIAITSSGDVSSKITLYYAVMKNAHQFSLRLPDGQLINLMPILKIK